MRETNVFMPIVQLIVLWQPRSDLDLVRVANIRLGILLNRMMCASRYLRAFFNRPSQLWQIPRIISACFAPIHVTLQGSNQVGVALTVTDVRRLRQKCLFQ